jgi:hypothetical protein
MAKNPNSKSGGKSQADIVAANAVKSAKFKELASLRVGKALAAINNVAKLANKRAYVYDDVQVAKIGAALDDALKACGAAFKAPAGSTAAAFTL